MSSIKIDGCEIPVGNGATFSISLRSERINIQTNEWVDEPMVAISYAINIDVNDQSGQDGTLAPSARMTILFEDEKIPHMPMGQEFAPYVLEPNKGNWEAFLGNDYWSLENNRIVINSFNGRAIDLIWSAIYGNQKEQHSFLFEGTAIFEGIGVMAHSADDLDRAIADTWNTDLLTQYLIKTNVKVDEQFTPPIWSAHYIVK